MVMPRLVRKDIQQLKHPFLSLRHLGHAYERIGDVASGRGKEALRGFAGFCDRWVDFHHPGLAQAFSYRERELQKPRLKPSRFVLGHSHIVTELLPQLTGGLKESVRVVG